MDCSKVIENQILNLHHQAEEAGISEAFVTALHRGLERLQEAPNTFGEPLYRLAALRIQVRSAVIPPLIFHFGVCEDRPLVFLKGVQKMAGSQF